MISLKKFFQPNPYLVAVSKPEKELLELFLAHKKDYEHWLLLHPQQNITFRFYYPTAIDFYFNGTKLYTAYFRRDAAGALVLHEFKMSKANYISIRSINWKPFAELIGGFLQAIEEKNNIVFVQKTKPLEEYICLCKQSSPAA